MDRFEEILEHEKKHAFTIENVGKLTKRKFFSIANTTFCEDYGFALADMLRIYMELKGKLPQAEWDSLKKEALEMEDDNSVRYL